MRGGEKFALVLGVFLAVGCNCSLADTDCVVPTPVCDASGACSCPGGTCQ